MMDRIEDENRPLPVLPAAPEAGRGGAIANVPHPDLWDEEEEDEERAEAAAVAERPRKSRSAPPDFRWRPHAHHPAQEGKGTGRAAIRGRRRFQRAKTVAKDKVGRNDPCPCGSGKKYKKCHGAAA